MKEIFMRVKQIQMSLIRYMFMTRSKEALGALFSWKYGNSEAALEPSCHKKRQKSPKQGIGEV